MKNAIFTIDTEGHDGKDPVSHLIYGANSNGEQNGIPLEMDILDEYGIKGLFFVDLAAAWDYGQQKIGDVLRYIRDRGHDVGVHIHPDHMNPLGSMFLADYSKEKQAEMIEKCTDFYFHVLGKYPVAFRAGKYGANRDTLDVLAQFGYKADFSQFYGYDKWCKITPPITGNQTVLLKNGLIEIPTMSYHNSIPGIFSRYDKLDINMSACEHHYVLTQLNKSSDVNLIVLFAHSFSLMRWRRQLNNPSLCHREMYRFRKALNDCQSQAIKFLDINQAIAIAFQSQQVSVNKPLQMSILASTAFAFPKAAHLVYSKLENAGLNLK